MVSYPVNLKTLITPASVLGGGFIKCKLFLLVLSFLLLRAAWAAAPNGEFFELQVAQGDSLINICKKYLEDPLQWSEVAKVNKLANPNRIYPGQKLIIPVRLLQGVPLNAEVTFIKGGVLEQPKGSEEWIQLNLRDRVLQGSRIRTGDEGSVEITFEDGATFLLSPRTTLGITTAQKKGAMRTIQNLFLQTGRAIIKSTPIARGEKDLMVRTPNAVAGVRGTDFRLSVDPEETTRVEVLRGIVGFEASRQNVEVKEAEGSIARKGEPPTNPRKLLPAPGPLDLPPLYKMMPLRFKFKEIEGASFYRVMLARDREFKDVVKEMTIRPEETLDIVGVEDGTYFLQSRSIDEIQLEGLPLEPVGVQVRVNPLSPSIQSPVDGAHFKGKSVRLAWLRVLDASSYHIQIAKDKEFSAIVDEKKGLKEVEFIAADLDFKTYYFRIRSIAEDGYEGQWSDVLSFTMVPPPPAPALEKPAVSKKEVYLKWPDLGKGIQYRFQMARDDKFASVLIERDLENPEITLPKPEEVGTYYIRTKGIDTDGYEGNFSLPQSFEVKPPPPPPVLEKPEVGKKEIRIKWLNLGHGIRYQFQMARDGTFAAVLLEEELDQPEISLTRPEESGNYYVRVRGINVQGVEGQFSSPQGFEIKPFPYLYLGGGVLLMGLILLLVL
jgi:hypothetical protein